LPTTSYSEERQIKESRHQSKNEKQAKGNLEVIQDQNVISKPWENTISKPF